MCKMLFTVNIRHIFLVYTKENGRKLQWIHCAKGFSVMIPSKLKFSQQRSDTVVKAECSSLKNRNIIWSPYIILHTCHSKYAVVVALPHTKNLRRWATNNYYVLLWGKILHRQTGTSKVFFFLEKRRLQGKFINCIKLLKELTQIYCLQLIYSSRRM